MKKAVAVLVVIGVILLGLRVLWLAASPEGRCVLSVQPSVIIGAAPSFMTDLSCAG